MNKNFEKIKEKLLDSGKGNRLINFKQTKANTLKILAPETNVIYDKILGGGTFSFFDTDNIVDKNNTIIFDENLQNDENLSLIQKVDESKLVQNYADKLKRNEILAFNNNTPIKRVLRNLKKIANNALEEKGLNVIYLAFGFLKWKENEKADYFMSPLILIPALIESNSISGSYTITHYEEEVTLNPTLVYKLKNEHGITLPEFKDEEDSSLLSYFENLENIFKENNWEVVNQIGLGVFSFLKMNMYKDYEENEETILNNTNIQKLLTLDITDSSIREELDTKQEIKPSIDIDAYFKEGKEVELHNIVDADSSQMEAILRAKNGESFVLQGPPGTGKSQTITNLIAEFLYDGKKVLFVSEKLAALNVVYSKLKNAGLEDFCLELHSYKTNKKVVIDELYRVLTSDRKSLSKNAESEIEELKRVKKELDSYTNLLHKKIEKINKTPYQILNFIIQNENVKTFKYFIKDLNSYDEEILKNIENELEKYILNKDLIGKDYKQICWYGFTKENYTYEELCLLEEDLKSLIKFLDELNLEANKINEVLNLNIDHIEDIETYEKVFNHIKSMTYFDKNFFKKSLLEKILKNVKEFNLLMDEYVKDKKQVDTLFNSKVYELDTKKLYLKFKNKYSKFSRIFNLGYHKDVKKLKQLLNSKETKLNYKNCVKTLYFISKVKDSSTLLKERLGKLKQLFSKNFEIGELGNFKKLETELVNLNSFMVEDISFLINKEKSDFEKFQPIINVFLDFNQKNKENFNKINKICEYFDTSIFPIKKQDFISLKQKFNSCLENMNLLSSYIKFSKILSNLKELNMLDFIDKSIENNVEIQDLSKVFMQTFYVQFMFDYVNNNEIFRDFTSIIHNSKNEKFIKQDKLKFNISKAEIISTLTQKLPQINDSAKGGQVSYLMREATKKRKQKPVRTLIKDVTELVQTIKPCFLMSPLSVSTYLDGNDIKFDVVIFDEASQIFPWDAIGSIYRAKQVIVVGDSKQMPPSNFFNSGFGDNEEYDDFESDSTDFESILDLCASTYGQTSLKWHYRSRTEDLIAFSNKHFYHDDLYTFPSTIKDEKNMGVDFYYVEDGVFNRSNKTNRKEAEKVVELVKEHYKENPKRSLGVVAFSISQQEMIENLINKLLEQDSDLREKIYQNIEEPFFVKNLETVQGDERDTIIFSVAYAKDDEGKFLHNFGPLNKKGGERRLNVAVTRAKNNVKLVSSIKSVDIDLKKTESVGARLLKEYLNCAEFGMVSLNKEAYEDEEFKSNIINDIIKVLSESGFKTEKDVGFSNKKIDIAVKDENDEYILAIECDGYTYASGKTTRDRDRLRKEILERMGWNYHRVWSLQWVNNKEEEKRVLLEKLNNIINGKIEEQKQEENSMSFMEYNENDNKNQISPFPYYIEFDVKNYCRQNHIPENRDAISRVVYDLVKQEAPITEEYLLKKCMPLISKDRIPSFIAKRTLNYEIKDVENIIKIDDYYVVNKDAVISLRIPKENEVREIENIAQIELEAGIKKVIEINVGLNKEGITKTITKLLGYNRQNENIKAIIEYAIENLVIKNEIILSENNYVLTQK